VNVCGVDIMLVLACIGAVTLAFVGAAILVAVLGLLGFDDIGEGL
jgi:hypothetical protein